MKALRLYTHTHTHTHTSSFYTKGKSLRKEKINKLDAKNASSSIMPYIPSVSRKTATAGITLIALVVTIVVLLILARNNYSSSTTRGNYRASK